MKLKRKEILDLLRSFGVSPTSELKAGCRDYETYFKKRQKPEDRRFSRNSIR
ncbi:MAG: hypothetical protein HOL15_10385 [Nitrospinaceae bacterium]|jgi:hypothetical protein|nr:hypothetical protein [Nitrospina sp.]MBT5377210.1 hypothetical protein [Nitrospinaceae bacterium]MBT5867512.1 hypothetical protein [Nitrospinaceae bacterium]MBT6345929.1 hypothetical protein [Nitrospina sp.]